MTARKSRKKNKKSEKEEEKIEEQKEPKEQEPEEIEVEDISSGAEMGALLKKAGERDEYYDMMLRARADLENFSKRVMREKEKWTQGVLRDFFSDLLPALDALHAALQHSDDDAVPILDGIRLTEEQILAAFGRNGISVIEPKAGDQFDPARHEAMMTEISEETEPGHVTALLRRGFTASDTLIRAAQVKVAAQITEENRGREKPEGGDNNGD